MKTALCISLTLTLLCAPGVAGAQVPSVAPLAPAATAQPPVASSLPGPRVGSLPPPAGPLPPPEEPSKFRSVEMMVGGIALMTLGAIAVGAGIGVYKANPPGSENDGAAPVEMALWGGGAAFLVAGIPLVILGARDPLPPTAGQAVSYRAPAWLPSVTKSPGGAGLRWSF